MEYRIGNYVNFRDRKDIDYCEIVELSRKGCLIWRNFKDGLFNDDQPESIDDLTGISLSIDWLERLGFEFYKPLGHYRIVINDIWVQVNVNEIIPGDPAFVFTFTNLNYDETEHMPWKVLKYVHKLQNLFYEIMDEELPYKEK